METTAVANLLEDSHSPVDRVDELGGGLGVASLPVETLRGDLEELVTRRHR